MSGDHFQRQIDFIVEQQAKFSESLARQEEQNRENTSNIARLADVVMSLAIHVERHDQQIAALIEQGKETDRRFREIEERINALIILAERFFNKNGQ
jgi:ABC-type transporter Mla subunit MlaD